MITDLNFKQIHEDNFNKYKAEKDEILIQEAKANFWKSPKIVFSILQDIDNEKKAREIFNEYCKFLENREKINRANEEVLALKDDQILKLESQKNILILANIVAIATLIATIIF